MLPTPSLWENHAKNWTKLGSPLRPVEEDLQFLKTFLLPKLESVSSAQRRVLILGVTPEIALLPWSEETEVIALDRCQVMIDQIWPANAIAHGRAIQGDWERIPLEENSCDVVVGDGCFTLLPYPEGYEAVLQSIARVLKPQGLLSIRFFLPPTPSESVETVFEDLWAGRIGNFHAFKLRLAMSLHESLARGVVLAEIWEKWHKVVPEPLKLAEQLNWSTTTIATIDAYRNQQIRYVFPTLEELREIFSRHVSEIACHVPEYELGDRCQTIVFHNT